MYMHNKDKLPIGARELTEQTGELVVKTGEWPSRSIRMYQTAKKSSNKEFEFHIICSRNDTLDTEQR